MDLYTEPGYGIARIRIEDSDSNYNYVVWCTETGECAVIDPIDPVVILNFIRDKNLTVRYVINTHCHPDHISGNDPILKVSLTHISRALVHPLGRELVGTRYGTVKDGDKIQVGKLGIKVTHTPGHCPEHITLILDKYVFTGDTLFLAGCGNIKHRGVIEDLYKTFADKIRTLPDDYTVFVGHDYAEANLKFALDLEPGNPDAQKKLAEVERARSEGREPQPSTIGEEKLYNPFMRYDCQALIEALTEKCPGLDPAPEKVFTELRRLRDEWTS